MCVCRRDVSHIERDDEPEERIDRFELKTLDADVVGVGSVGDC